MFSLGFKQKQREREKERDCLTDRYQFYALALARRLHGILIRQDWISNVILITETSGSEGRDFLANIGNNRYFSWYSILNSPLNKIRAFGDADQVLDLSLTDISSYFLPTF